MAIYINDAIENFSPKSLDNKYLKNGVTPYASLAEVNTFINPAYRSIGLTVLIGAQEYWYIGGTADINLIVKNIPTSINWGDIQGSISNQVDLSNILSQKESAILPGTVNQYWRGDKSWQTLTSDVVTEGSTNLYFTTSRARQSISAGTGISYNSTTGVVTCTLTPGTVSSVGLSITGSAVTIAGSPVTTTGTLALSWAGTSGQYITGAGGLVTFPTIPTQFNPIAGSGITISGSYPNITFNSVSGGSGTVTSVAVTMPAAFSVAGSPITSAGTIAITGAGTTGQYIRGDGTLATFPGGTVTSVALTVPSGLTVTGSPITTAGTLAITTTLNGVIHGTGSGFTAGSVNLATEVSGNLAVTRLNSGTGATGTTFWRGDGTWAAPVTVSPAGVTGSVQFNNAGAFGADANIFWDNTNKRLGIGTSAPSTALQISGTAPVLTTTFTSTSQFATLGLASPDKGTASLTLYGSANTPANILTLLGSTGGDISIRTIAVSTSAEVIRFTAGNTVQVASLAGTGTRMVVTSAAGVLSAQTIPTGVTSVALAVPAAFSVSGSPITTAGTITISAAGTSSQYIRGDGTLATLPPGTGTVTSVGLSFTGTAVTVSGSPVTNSGTLALAWAGTSGQYVTGAGGLTNFPSIPAQFSPIAGANVSITGTYPSLTFAATGSVSSVALTMPSAFTVSGSPITSSGTLAISGAGTTTQYIRGDGSLATFPSFVSSITLSGDVAGTGSSSIATTIQPGAVTYAKIQNVTGQRLLGRYSAATGSTQEISLGSGLSLNSGTGVLSSTGVTTNIYTADGTLAGNRIVTMAGNNLSFSGGSASFSSTAVVSLGSVSNSGSQGSAVGVQSNISDNGFTGSGGTRADVSLVAYAAPVVSATNTSVTFTNASTLYIGGAPTAGINVTIPLPLAIKVASGKSQFNDTVQIADGTQGAGKLFSSDASGNGSWITSSAAPVVPTAYSRAGTTIQNVTSFSGNATGRYMQVGNWVHATVEISLTSTSGGTIGNGTFTQFSIQVPTGTATSNCIGIFMVQEIGGTAYIPGFIQISGTTVTFTYLTVHAGSTNVYGSFDYAI